MNYTNNDTGHHLGSKLKHNKASLQSNLMKAKIRVRLTFAQITDDHVLESNRVVNNQSNPI